MDSQNYSRTKIKAKNRKDDSELIVLDLCFSFWGCNCMYL